MQPPPASESFYCPCARDLFLWIRGVKEYERFEESGVYSGESWPRFRAEHRVAQLAQVYALAGALIAGVHFCYRTLFGTQQSPSMLLVLCVNAKCFYQWLQEDLRRVAAITVMGVPVVLFITAVVLWCSATSSSRLDTAQRMFIIAALVALPCAWVSYVLWGRCAKGPVCKAL